jgi:hypothetical protein
MSVQVLVLPGGHVGTVYVGPGTVGQQGTSMETNGTPDILDQVQCTREASLNHCEGLLALRRVAPQRQDVLDAIAFHLQTGELLGSYNRAASVGRLCCCVLDIGGSGMLAPEWTSNDTCGCCSSSAAVGLAAAVFCAGG